MKATLDRRDLDFLLHELLDVGALCHYPRFADHDRQSFDAVLEAGERIAGSILEPAFKAMDREPPVFVDGRVRVHPSVRTLLRRCGEDGWIGAEFDREVGGQQLPTTIMTAFRGLLASANYSASVYPSLTAGAAHLVISFGSRELVETYVPRMLAGEWQGTMALTEPQAGSSLGDLRTRAVPTEHGYFSIKGEKIFISCADHDGADNVVNLALARIEGAPPGVKGISLFVVPRLRDDGDGGLVDNDVTTVSVFHKLGYRGAPIVQLAFGERGDCRGWLVGEPHKGLRCMFQLMNEARIDVGLGATAIAAAAYRASLAYTRQRTQGRAVTERDPTEPPVRIVEHPDVRRMLLFQRAIVEGSLALLLQCALWSDLAHVAGGEEGGRAALLLDLLTPVAKSYPSEMAVVSVSQGLQCLGGYGYCEDFPLEQLYRDVRIHPIHEGTTGIQALDLLGRKVVMQGGRATFALLEEIHGAIARAREVASLVPLADALEGAVGRLGAVTQHLTGLAMEGRVDFFLADATAYLDFFSVVTVAWLWLRQATVAEEALARSPSARDALFYRGKAMTARAYFSFELPRTEGLATRLLRSDRVALEMTDELFGE